MFAGSNLVNFTLNNTALTAPSSVSSNAGANAQRVYAQSFEQFKNSVIIDDESSLKRKLDQLKAILTSIHSNSRFDVNREELYKKQEEILKHVIAAP